MAWVGRQPLSTPVKTSPPLALLSASSWASDITLADGGERYRTLSTPVKTSPVSPAVRSISVAPYRGVLRLHRDRTRSHTTTAGHTARMRWTGSTVVLVAMFVTLTACSGDGGSRSDPAEWDPTSDRTALPLSVTTLPLATTTSSTSTTAARPQATDAFTTTTAVPVATTTITVTMEEEGPYTVTRPVGCDAEPGSPTDLDSEPAHWLVFGNYMRWEDGNGCPVRVDVIAHIRGAEHCEYEEAEFISLGPTLGESFSTSENSTRYIWNADGVIPGTAAGEYIPLSVVPGSAIDTEYRQDETELWIDPTDPTGIYLIRGEEVRFFQRNLTAGLCG